jgi:hypothetical protein
LLPDDCHSYWGEKQSQFKFYLHFFIAKNFEHFHIYVYAICTSENCAIYLHIISWNHVLLVFSFGDLLHILGFNPFSVEKMPKFSAILSVVS